MTSKELEERVYDILMQLTTVPRPEIRSELTLAGDMGMDSVSAMEMLGMLDEEFGMDVDIEETFEIKTVGQVLDLVRERVQHVAG